MNKKMLINLLEGLKMEGHPYMWDEKVTPDIREKQGYNRAVEDINDKIDKAIQGVNTFIEEL